MPLSKNELLLGSTHPCPAGSEGTQAVEGPFIKMRSVVVRLKVGMKDHLYVTAFVWEHFCPCTTALMCDLNETAGIWVEGINDLFSIC